MSLHSFWPTNNLAVVGKRADLETSIRLWRVGHLVEKTTET